jgi:methylisocitrate lyase
MTIIPLTAGAALRQAIALENPLQIVGAVNAYTAMMAERVGYRAVYLSGAGVANASFGLPDLGITTLNDALEDARRITGAVDIPLLVDADTGFGGAFSIARTVQDMIRAGVAGIHIEDQVQSKRCGHRPNKALVSSDEMTDRVKAAVDARLEPSFVIMARTDALAVEGLIAAIDRVQSYIEAGADMIFFEGVRELKQYKALTDEVDVPVLASLTEFGLTPLYTLEELSSVGIDIALYPLSAFRAMNTAALRTYHTIREEGTQVNVLEEMQTREALYDFLNYYAYERKLDELFTKENDNG